MRVTHALRMLMSAKFEVYGRVQGVFFRKYTNDKAKELGLKGWCRNTRQGTVEGVIQGPMDKMEIMKRWLQYEGSPESYIKECKFQDEQEISAPEFKDFKIKH
ncbi:acylphosphatase-1-like [Ornithodoros turicata]|uniref:acylphosphatase-1-like n=1 Tax=Ornithodoros turicata TaxID=34597 RepID=UPI00313913DF